MGAVTMFVIGVLVGCVFTIVISRVKPIGLLQIADYNPDDEPYLFLELSEDIDTLCQKKYVTLKVNVKNFNSHK